MVNPADAALARPAGFSVMLRLLLLVPTTTRQR
jgi:hypothetical protein